LVLLLVTTPAQYSGATFGFLPRRLVLGEREHRYVVYVPPGYTNERDWPLVMFLHGMGECGTDGKLHVEVGLGTAIRNEPQRWPFVVVMPQKPDKPSQWFDHEAMVMGMLAATEKEYRIDPSRRFLTGLSQGGAGTWALGSKHANVWAAIAPVCGYKTSAFDAAALQAKPIQAFHGEDDKVVPASQSKELCAAVEQAGGKPLLTLYARTAHNSWDQAYRESGLAEWLRMVAHEPLGARLLARPEELRGGAITIESAAPAKPTNLTLAPDADELARRAFVAALRRLQRDGLFDDRAAMPETAASAGARFDVRLHGVPGEWRFTRSLAPAQVVMATTAVAEAR